VSAGPRPIIQHRSDLTCTGLDLFECQSSPVATPPQTSNLRDMA